MSRVIARVKWVKLTKLHIIYIYIHIFIFIYNIAHNKAYKYNCYSFHLQLTTHFFFFYRGFKYILQLTAKENCVSCNQTSNQDDLLTIQAWIGMSLDPSTPVPRCVESHGARHLNFVDLCRRNGVVGYVPR